MSMIAVTVIARPLFYDYEPFTIHHTELAGFSDSDSNGQNLQSFFTPRNLEISESLNEGVGGRNDI
jgi:hypothetical protein